LHPIPRSAGILAEFSLIESFGEPVVSRWLIVVGLALIALGLLWPMIAKLGLGRLPGDIIIRREGFSFYFPIVTCLVVSAIISILIWIFRR
jgi:hypothetical protein